MTYSKDTLDISVCRTSKSDISGKSDLSGTAKCDHIHMNEFTHRVHLVEQLRHSIQRTEAELLKKSKA
jgi:hypothetical protein